MLPQQLNDKNRSSVAGNKYSLLLSKAINIALGNDNFLPISISTLKIKKRVEEFLLWEGKKILLFKSGNNFLSQKLCQSFNFFSYMYRWCYQNRRDKIIVMVNNSPAHILIPLLLLKPFFKIRIFSLTIDTPFTKEHNFSGIVGLYNYIYFKTGHFLLRFLDGIVLFHTYALHLLKLKIPYLITRIGFDKDLLDNIKIVKRHNTRFKICFAGTLVYYNGIEFLLSLTDVLDPNIFEFHIYGYGSFEDKVQEKSRIMHNVFFHGRINNMELLNILPQMDLLLNIRLIDDDIKYFTFPSKLIEYICAKVPVLTSNFPTLSPDLAKYLFVVEDLSLESITQKILEIYNADEKVIQYNVSKAYSVVQQQYSYKQIVSEIIDFVLKF